MNHEAELNAAVETVKSFRETKTRLSAIGVIGIDQGYLHVLDARIFGIPVTMVRNPDPESRFPHECSFTYNGIRVLSIHAEGEVSIPEESK